MGRKELKGVIDLCSPERLEGEVVVDLAGTPVRGVFCLKRKKANMREIEDREDCFILGFDPNDDSLDLPHIKVSKDLHNPNSPDLSVLAEKGQVQNLLIFQLGISWSSIDTSFLFVHHVACRDYPHPRHLCVKNCFEKTPHENHCEMCFCFVCDTAAPCKKWSGSNGHCHAINNEAWKSQRKKTRRRKE
ncbi:RPM1 interacting protein 13-like [Rhododendron vialii]|uniref:RPM1 interacting protein 13-like n=1 Tax=Rhododendron vialii TaxID=182163 RepID=UPI00265D63C5|nr:RPM1 interacting protein 13-like [Rhododendron vialii]